MEQHWLEILTPIGPILLIGTDRAITAINLNGHGTRPGSRPRPNALLRRAEQQLGEYFSGTRKEFDLPVAPVGTDFQHRVWKVLQMIPFGQTRSYGEIARVAGNPAASRAVGSACRSNPLPIVIPCHRVVGTNGHLTGFGGGLDRKAWLLQHEGSDV
ncbi:methylated-DNA--[protein]-cysteine S-methyltransferase [bacterium]|nr:methylated-DNA--[protein]-cysteine S-methyltransferase [bacterium]MBU1984637.1 methylated-DNA--[protein]-cysteine S-methyltransferase [bacterium]